ncbi:hypothetical protein T265_14433, partial [Opisthorchis viverrini]
KTQQIKSELSKTLRKVSGIDEESGTQHHQLEHCGEFLRMKPTEKFTDYSLLSGSTHMQPSIQFGQNDIQCLLEENALLEERVELYSIERKKLLSDNAYLDQLVDELQLQLRNVRSAQRPEMLDAATSTTDVGHNSLDNEKCRGCITLWRQLQDYVRLYGRLKIHCAKPTADLISTGPLGERDNDSECFTTAHLPSSSGAQEPCAEDCSDGSPRCGKRRTKSACLLTGPRVPMCVTNAYSELDDTAFQSDLRDNATLLPATNDGYDLKGAFDSVKPSGTFAIGVSHKFWTFHKALYANSRGRVEVYGKLSSEFSQALNVCGAEALYANSRGRVCVYGKLSSEFTASNGARQGCPLSSFLFNFVIETIMKDSRSASNACEVEVLPGCPLTNIEYVDNIAVVGSDPVLI